MQPSKRQASGFKVQRIQGFDFAYYLEPVFEGVMIKQQFDIERFELAPEIKEGGPHNTSADIWALGQVLYQMLSVPADSSERILTQNEEARWLEGVNENVKELAAAMTDANHRKRPSAQQVLSHPWISNKPL